MAEEPPKDVTQDGPVGPPRSLPMERSGAGDPLLASLFESCSDALFLLDAEGCLKASNRVGRELLEKLGSVPVEAGARLVPALPEDLRTPVAGRLPQALLGRPVTLDQHLAAPGGADLWLHITMQPVGRPEHDLSGALIRMQDRTELRRMEDRLERRRGDPAGDSGRLDEVKYRYRFDPEPRIEHVSSSVKDLTGYAPEEFYQDPELGLKIVHPDDRARLEEILRAEVRESTPAVVRWIRRDGAIIWTEHSVRPIQDDHGSVVGVEGLCRDITSGRRAEEALRRSERVLSALLGGLPGMAYRCRDDADWTMEMVTEGCRDLTGFEPQELIGNRRISYEDVIHPQDRAWVRLEVSQALGQGRGFQIIYRIRTAEGMIRWVWERGRAAESLQDEGPMVEGFISDITELKEAQLELAQARDQAVEATRMKSQFLASISHEIRTPINGVIGMTRLLLQTDLSREQKEFAATLRVCAESLLSLVTDILDYSKMEAGKLALEAVDFELDQVADEAAALAAVSARNKGLELIVRIDREVPMLLLGDPARLRQVLSNLVTNAVRYTDEGEVEIRVRCESRRGHRVRLRFTVRDTGMGIPPREAARLFQPFTQGASARGQGGAGSGLGLAISKQLVEMMNGRIGVESDPGKGSAFWFSLPLQARQEEGANLDFGLRSRGGRVVVLERNAAVRSALLEHLDAAGLSVRGLETAAETLDFLHGASAADDPVDLLILGLRREDSAETAELAGLRSDPGLGPIRLLLMAEQSWDSGTRNWDSLRPDLIMYRPLGRAQLLRAAAELLSVPRSRSRRAGAPSREGEGRVKPLQGRVLVVEDNEINQRVTLLMVEDLGCRADIMPNGREAVEAIHGVHYDLILMDIQMPVMDGLEATVEIRRREEPGEHIPIVGVSAGAVRGERERCLASGMDDYISKPVTPEVLRAVLSRWLPQTAAGSVPGADEPDAGPVREESQHAGRTAAGEAGDSAEGDSGREGTEERELDEVLDMRMLRGLSKLGEGRGMDAPTELNRIFKRDVRRGLREVRLALDGGDAVALRRAVHAIKGSGASLGTLRFCRVCTGMEEAARNGDLTGAAALAPLLEEEAARAQDALSAWITG